MIELPLSKAFQLIEPGPVVLVVSTQWGKANIMTLSWHMLMDFTPLIGCIIDPGNYTFATLRSSKECVIAIPTVDIANRLSSGNTG